MKSFQVLRVGGTSEMFEVSTWDRGECWRRIRIQSCTVTRIGESRFSPVTDGRGYRNLGTYRAGDPSVPFYVEVPE